MGLWEPLGAAEATGTGVSWRPGFMEAHRETPRAMGVGPMLQQVGSGIPCEVRCLLHSPPIGRVSLHRGAWAWGTDDKGSTNLLFPIFLNASFLISVFHPGSIIPYLEFLAFVKVISHAASSSY